ncbi:MAG: hypothetical protein L6R35_001353 [Caloplaca aegaea]|nr:MAG: hypothetical protein L6R35_001353 [Caloplaca aegaea]
MSFQLPPGTDLSMVPAAKPPPGVTPQFQHPSSLTPTLIGLIGDIAQYFRHGWDLPLSWYTPTYIKVMRNPLPLVAKQILTSGKLLYAQGMLLGPTIFFSKEAIFLLYFEVFQVKNQMRLAIIFGMVFTGFVYWTGVIIESIYCAPRVGEGWDPLAGAPVSIRCQKTIYWGIVQGACAILIDLLIFVLPIPIVMKLQLPTRRKVQILCVFMTALMGILASVFAEVYRVRLLTHAEDQSWEQARQLICVQVIMVRTDRSQISDKPVFRIVENWVAVIVSCTPAFAKFCRLYIGESHFFASLRSQLSVWISSARSTLNKPLHQSDGSHVESQGGLRPRSLPTAGPYYHLEERTPSRDAKSWMTQDARSAVPLST